MYTSPIGVTSAEHRSSWLVFCAILVWLPACLSQNEMSLRSVQTPYPLSFSIFSQVSGSNFTYGPNDTLGTSGKFYRTLALWDGELFVGGKAQLFSVDPADLRPINNVSIPSDSVVSNCDEFCDNYIRVIQPLSNEVLLECGTNYFAPYCQQRSPQNLSTVGSRLNIVQGLTLVPSAHHQNSSWLLVNDTDYTVFAASNLLVNGPNDWRQPAIVRASLVTSPPSIDVSLRTVDNPNTVLDGPEFVGDPIEYNGHIYFFFREFANEYANGYSAPIVYSRVGIVCKNDTGGREFSLYDKEMVTFVKTRLECFVDVDGKFPYHYNQIQDIYHSTVNTNVVFGIFATRSPETASSAVCAYRLDELEALFQNSAFRAQQDNMDLWTTLTDVSALPAQFRQARCPNTANYNVTQYQAILRLAQLMDDAADNKLHYETTGTSRSNPLLVCNGERFSQIVVDEDVLGSMDIMFIGTENGTVLKAYLNENRSEARIVEEISLNTETKTPVLTMLKSDQAVFVGTDIGVFKIPFEHCQDYPSLRTCLDARDPYCKWNRSCIHSDEPGQQDLENGSGNSTVPNYITIHAYPKDQLRTLNIPNQPVNLYLLAEAPEGMNLRVVNDEIKCNSCNSLPFTPYTATSLGVEFLTLHINGSSSYEMNNCSCSCVLIIDSGVTESANFTLTADISQPITATPEEIEELVDFDNSILDYKNQLQNWRDSVGDSCGLKNVQVQACPANGCP